MRSVLRSPKTRRLQHKRLISAVLQFAILFAFWLILSGIFQIKYILIGAFSAGLVTFLTNDLLYDTLRYGEPVKPGIYSVFVQILRFVAYLPWLLSRIIMANVQVAYLVLLLRLSGCRVGSLGCGRGGEAGHGT